MHKYMSSRQLLNQKLTIDWFLLKLQVHKKGEKINSLLEGLSQTLERMEKIEVNQTKKHYCKPIMLC